MPGCRARPQPTRAGTRTAPALHGRSAQSLRSSATPGTPAGRCGTASGPTSTWPTPPTPRWGTGRCSGGTCPKAGSSPSTPRIRRWSARLTSSPPRTLPRARPGRAGSAPVPAGRAHGVRTVRATARISLVQRQARLPVPPRLHQRYPPRTGTSPERLRAGGPDPPAPGRHRHPARRPRRGTRPGEPRPGAADRPGRHGSL
jgi:hypothetical protein